jgi:hypothetical protein
LFTAVSVFVQPTDKEEKEIPLPNVKAAVLKKVVEYMTYHVDNLPKEIEKPLKSANMSEVVPKWDADFVDVDQELLFELILVCCTLSLCAPHPPPSTLSPPLTIAMAVFRPLTTWISNRCSISHARRSLL